MTIVTNPAIKSKTNLKKAHHMLRILVNYKAQVTLDLIKEHPEGICVTDIQIALRINDQAIVSQILANLRKADVVITKRYGKYIKYSLNNNKLRIIEQALKTFI